MKKKHNQLREEIVQALLLPEVREVLCELLCDRLARRILAGRTGEVDAVVPSVSRAA